MFEALCKAAEDYDEDRVNDLLAEAEEAGIPISLDDEAEEADWTEDYPVVTVDYTLKLGDVAVADWQRDYSGAWGSGGTGWWIEVLNDDTPENVDFILECAGIRIFAPYVPSQPDEGGASGESSSQ